VQKKVPPPQTEGRAAGANTARGLTRTTPDDRGTNWQVRKFSVPNVLKLASSSSAVDWSDERLECKNFS
jgi:hypothetical protein